MSNRRYPYVAGYTKAKAKGEGKCHGCGGVIAKGEVEVVAEIQVSWFRGEDEYDHYHERCDPRPAAPKIQHNPPDPARRTCPECGKMFPVRRDMIQHRKAKHPTGPEAKETLTNGE